MTDDQFREMAEPAVRRARDTRGHRLGLLLALLAAAAMCAFGLVYLNQRSELRGEIDQLGRQAAAMQTSAAAADAAARALADQVRALGQTPVVTPRPDPPTPVPARGIAGTTVTTDGRLLVAYSDGVTEDKGRVLGKDGKDGVSPPGITGAELLDGVLVLRWSDGRAEILGRVIGPTGATGRGIRSVTVAEGRLVVTYDDGTTQDAGALPPGPPGPPGPAGRGITRTEVRECRWYVTYSTGETEDAGPACATITPTTVPSSTPRARPTTAPTRTSAR
ncbi:MULTISPECIES: hypothetical protein [unclassified Crossiella]|uniref:hypothetical protein n=1 Tax=unclassified Crossiella TaxID=2620835 RepID=UPI001FFF8B26|nr:MULTISPECIES: hypothetical protein [unclassified Crossiella]MCK2242137.1 hypothetical protein [Crossiella sp. S99.2]MCK2256040.1 hypothetical protein [Crossiella sp. S99.1]